MNQTLIIRFTDKPDAAPDAFVEWLAVDESGRSQYGSGSQDALVTLTPAEQVILLFPASRVLFTRADIPSKNSQQIQQAARALIEESLIDDIDKMHILTRRSTDNQVDIAAVSQDYLQGLVDLLEQHQLTPHIAVPDCLAIPLTNNGWTIIENNNGAVIRTGHFSGIQVDRDWLKQSDAGFSSLGTQTPEQLSVYRTSDVQAAIDYALWFEDIEIDITPVEQPQLLLEFAIQPSALITDTNFLSGEFTPRRAHRYNWINWRLPVYSAAAGLLLFTLVLLLQGQRYNSQLADVRQQTDTLFRQTLPDITTIVDYRLQFERELKRYQANGSGNPSTLGSLRQVLLHLKNANQLTLLRLSYTQTNIVLDIQSPDIGSAEQLISNINRGNAYAARLLSAQNQNDGTRIRIQLTPGASS